MAIRYIQKTSGTTQIQDRPNAAGFQYDTADGFLKYNDAGKVRPFVAAGRPLAPISLTAATLTLDPNLHDQKVVITNINSGFTITLPAATGSGAYYRIMVGTTLTGGSGKVQVANANDYMRGQASTVGSSGITVAVTANTGTPSSESDTITWNRTTTGLGTIGDYIECYDMAANVWSVEAIYSTAGQAAATPFSAAV